VKKVVIFDYGFGNLRSAERAFSHVGANVNITKDYDDAINADGLVIPGVGSFAACMNGFELARGKQIALERFKNSSPVFGICVGHQIMFNSSTEGGEIAGIGLLRGNVEEIRAETVPHIGWNKVEGMSGSALFNQIDDPYFYFVHSYAVLKNLYDVDTNQPPKFFYTEHDGNKFISAVEYKTLFGSQFHPEKSGHAGLQLIENWVKGL
jgi:glutamine amidotransferase